MSQCSRVLQALHDTGLKVLSSLQKLQHLALRGSDSLNGEGLAVLRSMSSLKVLTTLKMFCAPRERGKMLCAKL